MTGAITGSSTGSIIFESFDIFNMHVESVNYRISFFTEKKRGEISVSQPR